MDNNIGKALWIGIGILFFIAVVSLGLTLLDQGRGIAEQQSDQLTEVQKRLSDAQFDIYDNQSVAGSQVLGCIKSFREASDTFGISVKTNKGTVIYLNDATFSGSGVSLGNAHTLADIETMIKEARDESDTAYINPVATFDAQIRKDSNGVVSGIVFSQE
ncbi:MULTISPECIES: hypothetical protein [unclassified Fusibacter]|uniref:hypothetical protein n=1 Tax=unclassified Fusibacter TaxID=2624464 RepID=UPI0010137487|nr:MULTISPECIES: hypothetical protein [unclassified Fusibacter]MCK8060834.1 hypothetical protein [Fusibacter sp. A2]NPE23130.1 hypothetical protein [Fusibacter sp. A1]RXV59802.1 hypothetical protein DWB64_14960 [Fusibacter sp. A1]